MGVSHATIPTNTALRMGAEALAEKFSGERGRRFLAPKERNNKAQGNALGGSWTILVKSPNGAK